jgi:hypothetical protein
MQQYNGSMFYKLYRALQDEGIPDSGMVFETNPTFVSDLGFFTLRFDWEYPQVVHFLVWEDKRVYPNLVRLYIELKKILIRWGIIRFIALVPDRFWLQLFRVCGEAELYADEGGRKFYIVRMNGRNLQ